MQPQQRSVGGYNSMVVVNLDWDAQSEDVLIALGRYHVRDIELPLDKKNRIGTRVRLTLGIFQTM
jgi:hypothetical protein